MSNTSKLKIAVPAKVDQALGRLLLHGIESDKWEDDKRRVEAFISDLDEMADKARSLLDRAIGGPSPEATAKPAQEPTSDDGE